MNNRIFESVYSSGKNIAPKFTEFREIFERTDFSNVDKKKLNDIYLWGDDSSLFDKDKSLMQALSIDTEDEQLMAKIASSIPSFSKLFSADVVKKTKAIDMLKAQVEFIKVNINAFENSLLSTITGKEEEKGYESKFPGIRALSGPMNVSQELINSITRVFSRVTGAPGKTPLKPSIDQFVSSDEGKGIIKFLEEIGAKISSVRVIDNLFKKSIEKLGALNIDVAMRSADNTELQEITNDSVSLREEIDYVSLKSQKSEMELMQSFDPFVRLGMFYQLCIQQEKEFSDRLVPTSLGQGISYSDILESGKIAEESLKIIAGRDIDLEPARIVMDSLNSVSKDLIRLSWESSESDDIRAALFTPAMQVSYIAFMNFVVMKALYLFLTKKTEIVAAEEKSKAEKIRYNQLSSGLIIPDFSDPKLKEDRALRAKTIFAAMDLLKKEGFFDKPNELYSEKRGSLNPEAISLLKIVFAATPQLKFTEKIPIKPGEINGTFTKPFRDSLIEFQKMVEIRPDGIIGPNTRNALLSYERALKQKYSA